MEYRKLGQVASVDRFTLKTEYTVERLFWIQKMIDGDCLVGDNGFEQSMLTYSRK
jgi:hypothetical protein